MGLPDDDNVPDQAVALCQKMTLPVSLPEDAPSLMEPALPRFGSEKAVWQGAMEWTGLTKNPANPEKLFCIPCQISAFSNEETNLNVENWPRKFVLYFVPMRWIRIIGRSYFREPSGWVVIHPSRCKALKTLRRALLTGFVGCTFFTSAPDTEIRVLIVYYNQDGPVLLGLVPTEQTEFIARLTEVARFFKTYNEQR